MKADDAAEMAKESAAQSICKEMMQCLETLEAKEKELQKLKSENQTLKAENQRLNSRLKVVYSTLGKVNKPKHIMQAVKRKIKAAVDFKKEVTILKQEVKRGTNSSLQLQRKKEKVKNCGHKKTAENVAVRSIK